MGKIIMIQLEQEIIFNLTIVDDAVDRFWLELQTWKNVGFNKFSIVKLKFKHWETGVSLYCIQVTKHFRILQL